MKWAIKKGPEGTVQKQALLLIAKVEPVHNGHLGNGRNWSLWRGVCYEEVALLYDIFLGVELSGLGFWETTHLPLP